jgi:hypothetical protein
MYIRHSELAAPKQAVLPEVRCACARCGAHVRARLGRMTLSGMCSVCGSPELAHLSGGEPVAPRGGRPLAAVGR